MFVVTAPGMRALGSVEVLVDVSELLTGEAVAEAVDAVSEDIEELVALGTVLEDTEGGVLGVVDVPRTKVVDGVVKIAGEGELEGVVVVNVVVAVTVVDALVVTMIMTEELVVVVAGGALYVTARYSVRPLCALQPIFVY